MLAGRKERRDLPFEVGEWYEFRTLSGREMDEAQEVATEKATRSMKAMGAEIISALQAMNASQQAKAPDAYDADTLIRFGLTAWSYPEPCDDEHKALLDNRCRDWAAAQIIQLNSFDEGEAPGSAEHLNGAKSRLSSGEPTDSTVSASS